MDVIPYLYPYWHSDLADKFTKQKTPDGEFNKKDTI